jgi:prepilin-type N-terminal cleavage/methylation domain-containing protein
MKWFCSSQTTLKRVSDGFTLVESMVAIIVGAILVGSLTLVVSQQAKLSQKGRDLLIADNFAEGKIEAVRSQGYLGLTNGTTNITNELPSELQAPRSASLTISDQDSGLKKVVLTLTYSDQGPARTYSYSTYVGELGVGQY